ncbi:SAM-dependent methyltransferase [soil metagenome]
MSEPLQPALDRLRDLVLDDSVLVRAVGAGRQKGRAPRWRRVELRYVDFKAGRRLQATAYDESQAHTSNHESGDAPRLIEELLGEPFGNWHVETTTETHQLRVTKKLQAMVHVGRREPTPVPEVHSHDRSKPRLLAEDHPVLRALGIADANGRVKPTRQAKYRQVEEFLRNLDAVVTTAVEAGRIRMPTMAEPLRIVDLGCGNAYLTFAAHAFLSDVRGLPVQLLGVDRQPQLVMRNQKIADNLGLANSMRFVPGDIGSVEVETRPDVVLTLHACDTATDDALARAVTWDAPLVLAAPCCHHDVAAQLRRAAAPAPYSSLTRDGILRERFADTLTDAVRASVLRLVGYRVEVIDFVDSVHTPRNTLLRAVRTGAAPTGSARNELDELTRTWGVHPQLAELLRDRLV